MLSWFNKPPKDEDNFDVVEPITIKSMAYDMSKTPLYKNNVSYTQGMMLKNGLLSDNTKIGFLPKHNALLAKSTLTGLNTVNKITKDYGARKNPRDLYHNVYKVGEPFGGKKKRTKKRKTKRAIKRKNKTRKH